MPLKDKYSSPFEPGLAGGQAGSYTHAKHAGLFNQFQVEFTSRVSGKSVSFPAIVTNFSDSYRSSWDETEYYGRMDSVAKFKSTNRTIDFELSVVADGPGEAAVNLNKFQQLARFLYPSYRMSENPSVAGGNALLIDGAPIIGIRMGNLIQDGANGGQLVGWIDGFEMAPDMDAQWFHSMGLDAIDTRGHQYLTEEGNLPDWAKAPPGTPPIQGAIYLPQKYDFSVSFHVLHQHVLGWNQDNEWSPSGKGFPYNSQAIVDTMPPDLMEVNQLQRGLKVTKGRTIVDEVKRGLLDALLTPEGGFGGGTIGM